MNQPFRALWGLTVVGGAVAVAVATGEPGFTAITLVGGLALPRILGLRGQRQGRRAWAGSCGRRDGGRSQLEGRLGAWHQRAHGAAADTTTGVSTAAAGTPV